MPGMPTIDLPWWPPVDEPIGEERAQEVIERLREIAGPVFRAAAVDLRSRIDPHSVIVRSGAPAAYIARCRFDDPQVKSLCVGTVYQNRANPAAMNSIQLMRDGMLTWRRD